MLENKQRDIVDENGNEAINEEENVNSYNTEKLSNFTQYSSNQPPDLDMSDSELSRKAEELERDLATNAKSTNSAAAGARKAAISVRTGQNWAKKLREEPQVESF